MNTDRSFRIEGFNCDILSKVLSYLSWKEVMNCRIISKSMRDAASKAPIAEEFHISSSSLASNTLKIARCLSNIQTLKIDQASLDILNDDDSLLDTLSRWSNLRNLKCLYMTKLVKSFSTIQNLSNLVSLDLHGCEKLEWNLSNLGNLPQLRKLTCINNRAASGDTNVFLSYKTLEVVGLSGCQLITGDLSDFAKLSHLQILFLDRTKVEGDLRKTVDNDFPVLRICGLSEYIYGASELDKVSHAPAVMRGRFLMCRRSTEDCPIYPFRVHLSRDSPDYHERVEQRLYVSERDPPFNIETVKVGSRRGWRWSNYLGGHCEVNWLEAEPKTSDPDYGNYIEELHQLTRESMNNLFAGFLEPPTREEYQALRLSHLLA